MVLFIYGAWALWAMIWVAMARGVKAVARRESVGSRALHLVPLAIAAALLADPRGEGRLLDTPLLTRAWWMVYAGALVVVVGLAFAVWARVVLAGNWSGTVTLKRGHELVVRGPYRLVRHPIYTGLLTALFGTMVAIDAWRALLAVVIVAASFVRKMRTEEAFMQGEFGAAYEAYAARVPALLPWL
jgi:protein-S-isoprenylcysteine O-methyltransferase Ste14